MEEEVERLGATGAELLGEVAPWTGCPWVAGAELQMLQTAGAAAMEVGCLCQGWTWWWYSVARAAAC